MNKACKLPFIDYVVTIDVSRYEVKPINYGLYADVVLNLNWHQDHAPYVNFLVYSKWFKFKVGCHYLHERDEDRRGEVYE